VTSNLLLTLFAFLITLGLVVIVHELGHFLVCKIFGVYVKTFSIGIGPKILRRRWGDTEYVLSAIPFGGYVKMAGEGVMEEIQDTGTWEERKYPLGTIEGNREAAGLDEDIPADRLFNLRPAWQRLLVFVAGPLFNLVLSYVIYSGLIAVDGLPTVPFTTVGEVREETPAAAAGFQIGDRILAVEGASAATWGDFEDLLVPPGNRDAGRTPPVTVTVERDGLPQDLRLAPVFDAAAGYWSVGLQPWNTTVGLVQRGGPADRAGLSRGDEITEVAGQPVTSFGGIAARVNARPGEEIELRWLRDGVEMSGTVQVKSAEIQPGEIGGRIFIEPFYGAERVSFWRALQLGYDRTTGTIRITVDVLSDFVRRKLGLDAVGGPLRIGQAAGEMLRWSFSHLMLFIAFFSINLFLLNLMPIPVLDGGHVLFLLLEVARGGKPIPERLQAIATQMGLIVLLLFMTFVVVLDVWKVTGH